MAGAVHVVVGGQYGSEAKGHIAAQLVKREIINYAVRVGGPNAGHSVVDSTGRRFALRTIPVAAAVNDTTRLVIGAGSEIDVDVLFDEINELESAGHSVRSRLHIDRSATIITPEHKAQESGLTARLGSTAKGIGAARAARLMRNAPLASEIASLQPFCTDTQHLLNQAHITGGHILIEGTQGFQLGLHGQHYPFCTSGNCRAIDFLAQSGLHPHNIPFVWVVYRTYPIRVAGNSGPLPRETDWEILAQNSNGYIKPERTTVTKKVRRVAHWSSWDAKMALEANGGVTYPGIRPVLMFTDYLDPAVAEAESMEQLQQSKAWPIIETMERESAMKFMAFGTSPHTIIWRD